MVMDQVGFMVMNLKMSQCMGLLKLFYKYLALSMHILLLVLVFIITEPYQPQYVLFKNDDRLEFLNFQKFLLKCS